MPNFGDDTQGSSSSPGSTDRCLVTLFTTTEDGTITNGYAYFTAGSSSGASAKVVVYSDSSGTPGTLVSASAGAAVPAGGGLVDLGSMSGSLTSSTNYFVGVVYSDFQADLQVDGSLSGMNTDMANGTLSYSSPPASWPGTDISYDNNRVNAYVSYTAGGGGGTARLIGGILTNGILIGTLAG